MKAESVQDVKSIIEGLDYRPMTLDDLEEVLDIEEQSFSMPWTPDMFIVEFGNSNSQRRVIAQKNDGAVLAYMIYWTVLDEAHLMSIAVHPDWRGLGLGALLMEKLIAEGREAGVTVFSLEVNVRNATAIAMYKRFGFTGFGLRKKYYEDTGDDALLMELKIS